MRNIKGRFRFQSPLFFLVITAASFGASQDTQQNSALLPETWARNSAIDSVLPVYPVEAVQRAIRGVVRVRFETNPEGEVVRIKIKPGTHPLLSKAIVDSLKRWRYKPWTGIDRLNEAVISRLTFHFVIVNGDARVVMYDPGPHPRLMDCLGCSNSNKEMLEWKEWEETWSNGEPSVEPSSP
jgi:TonB family protein